MKNSNLLKLLLAALVLAGVMGLTLASCGVQKPGEETLRAYGGAVKAYLEARYEDAIDLLAGVKKFPPGLILKGKAEYFAGRIQEAEKTFRRACTLSPGGAEAQLYLARTLRDQGKIEEAGKVVEKILAGNPLNIQALRLAAGLAKERGPGGEAEETAFLDRAADACAEGALVFLDRARLRWKEGRGKEALDDLKKARYLLVEGSPLAASVENLERVIRRSLKKE